MIAPAGTVVVKYKADGAVDTSFGSGGVFSLGSVKNGKVDYLATGGLASDAGGRLYVSYSTGFVEDSVVTYSNTHVLRLTSGGKVDTSYGTGGQFNAPTSVNDDVYDVVTKAITVTKDGKVLLGINQGNKHELSQTQTIAISPTSQSQGTIPNPARGLFSVTQIVTASDGSVYLYGAYQEAGSNGYDSDGYALAVRLTADLEIDTIFSADHDGTAGYRVGNDAAPIDLSLELNGDLILLGASSVLTGGKYVDSAQLVRIDGPSKFTRVSYGQSGGKLTVNGSDADDHMTARTVYFADDSDYGDVEAFATGSVLVRLDDGPAISSADIVNVNVPNSGQTPVTGLVFYLNGGNNVLDAHKLKQGIYVNAGAGNDAITGSQANDTLYGGAGVDTLLGGGGTDKIVQDT